MVTRLHEFGFNVIAARCDGASQNRKLLDDLATIQASNFISSEWMEELQDGDLHKCMVASRHPVTQRPIFLGTDDPHNWKRVRNHLDCAGDGARNLCRPKCIRSAENAPSFSPANLKMLERCWVAVEGSKPSTMRVFPRLTLAHWRPTRFLKMRVPHAVQVLSNSAIRLIHTANAAGHLDEPGPTKDEPSFAGYDFLLDFLDQFNKTWDIVNSRPSAKGESYVGPEMRSVNDDRLQVLVDFVVWLKDWHTDVHRVLTFDDAENAFLGRELYADLVQSCLSSLSLVRYCLVMAPELSIKGVVLRRLQQDMLEHHFAHIRSSTGSTSSPSGAEAARGSSVSAGAHITGITNKSNCKLDERPCLRHAGSAPVYSHKQLMFIGNANREADTDAATAAVAYAGAAPLIL